MKDYKAISQQIIEKSGGSDNIINSFYCMTRLRLNLKDRSKADLEAIKLIEGVMGVKNQQGQIQVIIGPDVNKLHEEFIKISPNTEETSVKEQAETDKAANNETVKDSLFTRVTAYIAGIFIPIVPCLAGAGIISAVLSALSYFGVITGESETYIVLNLIQNAVFYFLPFLIAISAAEKFKTNKFFAAVMAGVLLSPTIMNAIGEGIETYHVFGIPLVLSDCSSTVIPIILSVALLKVVEKFFTKIIPSALRIMLVPGLAFLVTGIASLAVFAPIGVIIGQGLSYGIDWAMGVSSILGGTLLGVLHLPMVVTGTHFIEIPLIVQEFATGGGTAIMPITSMGNTALVGALAALIVKTKSVKKKGEYSSIMVPTVMGITEPSLYGVAVVLKVPFVAAMIGGGIGGAIVAISGFKLTIMGVPGIFAGLVNAGTKKGIWFLIGEIVAIAAAFIVTYIVYKPQNKEE